MKMYFYIKTEYILTFFLASYTDILLFRQVISRFISMVYLSTITGTNHVTCKRNLTTIVRIRVQFELRHLLYFRKNLQLTEPKEGVPFQELYRSR